MNNLFHDIPATLPSEKFDILVSNGAVRIERIVSRGHTSPVSGWYEQEQSEFVLLLRGAAKIEFEKSADVEMGPGDWLDIAAGKKHRVTWTDPDSDSVWLAVHYDQSSIGA